MVLKVIVESRFSSECNGQPSECYKQGNNICFVKKLSAVWSMGCRWQSGDREASWEAVIVVAQESDGGLD